MKKSSLTLIGALGILSSTASGALVWAVGVDNGNQTAAANPSNYLGTTAAANPIQEINTNTLPGNPANTGGAGAGRDIDDDFYFEGVYNTVVDGSGYSPVGVVGTREANYERAFTGGDRNLRWHFNTPANTLPTDIVTFTIELYNLDDNGAGTGQFALEMFIDGVSQGTQNHTQATRNVPITWSFTGADMGGSAEAGAGFDHYVEVRSTASGGARWTSLDYVQLDSVPEPSSHTLGLLALTLPVFIRRRK